MKRWLPAALSAVFSLSLSHSLEVTEIFWRATAFYRAEERFIELHNNSDSPIPLSGCRIVLPVSASACQTDALIPSFYPAPATLSNAAVLAPDAYAVILAEGAERFAGLLPVAPGTAVVRPARKGGFTSAWEGRLDRVKLLDASGGILWDGGRAVFLTNELRAGLSLSVAGGVFCPSHLSPGSHSGGALWTDAPLYRPGNSVRVRFSSPIIESANLECVVTSPDGAVATFQLRRAESGLWETDWAPPWTLPHGSLLALDATGCRLLVRCLDAAKSSFYGHVFFNEIVPSAVHDWSSTWNGSPGTGAVTESDDWLELVNTGITGFSVATNHFLLVKTTSGESVRTVTARYSSATGAKGTNLPARGYLVVTPEGGLPSEGEAVLFEGYPYRNGLEVASCAWASSNEAAGESLSRTPNGIARQDGAFRSASPTFGAPNGSSAPELFCPELVREDSVEVFLVDTRCTNSQVRVSASSPLGSRLLTLTNGGYHFAGTLRLLGEKEPSCDGAAPVRNGGRVTLSYPADLSGIPVTAFFRYALPGWELPRTTAGLDACAVYPNPLRTGRRTLRVANLPAGASAVIVGPNGAVVARITNYEKGAFECEREWKAGIHTVVIFNGEEKTVRRVLVY